MSNALNSHSKLSVGVVSSVASSHGQMHADSQARGLYRAGRFNIARIIKLTWLYLSTERLESSGNIRTFNKNLKTPRI